MATEDDEDEVNEVKKLDKYKALILTIVPRVPSLAVGRFIVVNLRADFAFVLYDSASIGLYPVENAKYKPTQQQITPLHALPLHALPSYASPLARITVGTHYRCTCRKKSAT
jgi:hypothetical protein